MAEEYVIADCRIKRPGDEKCRATDETVHHNRQTVSGRAQQEPGHHGDLKAGEGADHRKGIGRGHAMPVVVDGFIGGAAFLIARAFYAAIGDHVFFGHRSAELAHERLLAEAGAKPLLDLGLRLGEGTGAALAMGILASAVSLYREMATFSEASVSDIESKEPGTK